MRLEKKTVEEVAPETNEETTEAEAVIDSSEYQTLVDKYTDKNGKLSYELLNKDLIRFVHSSKTVRSMMEDGVSLNEIRSYIVCSKFRTVIGRKLTEAQVLKMADLLDEVSPKSVFKEVDAELRRLSVAKNK
ncbi:MAG: hypothetical protein IJK14_08855 [Clostridia bacterium]|nr:hypothetical protein [Clostridia bacterium]MBR0445461.1 hypothetical protein [Clostridia bacterium]